MAVEYYNVQKNFTFMAHVENVPLGLLQTITLPKVMIDIVEHGAGSHVVKTGGQMKVEDATMKFLNPSDSTLHILSDWFYSVRNANTGGGLTPSLYKRNLHILSLDDVGLTNRSWLWVGAFPVGAAPEELDKSGTANHHVAITFAMDRVVPQ